MTDYAWLADEDEEDDDFDDEDGDEDDEDEDDEEENGVGSHLKRTGAARANRRRHLSCSGTAPLRIPASRLIR